MNEVFYTVGTTERGSKTDRGVDGEEEEEDVKEEVDWLAETTSRVAELYTQDGMDRSEWYNLQEERSPSSYINNNKPTTTTISTSNKEKTRALVKDGYLFMKSTGRLGRAVWHRRWFELDGECLSYIKGPETLDEV